MKYLILFVVFFFTLNCSINKVSNSHGTNLVISNFDKIKIGKTNKNDITQLIGPPSSKSEFDDTWFYIQRKKTNQSLFKLGKQKISENNVVIIKFNKMGIISHKKLLDLKDMNDLEFAKKITSKKFTQDNRIYNLLSTVREKINAPSRRKSNGGP